MKDKHFYVAPECEPIAIAPRGVIAQSPTANLDMGNPFNNTPSEEISWNE